MTYSYIEFFILLFESVDNFLWSFLILPLLLGVGTYLSYKSNFMQVRCFPKILSHFYSAFTRKPSGNGVHPLKAFFTCIGGCMGVGNVVAVCTAVQIGGPGALFWIWTTALIGVILKYSEAYLGMRFRVYDGKRGYCGGPMYFLQRAFHNTWLPKVMAFLMCIYGVEIYQFSVVTENLAANLEVNKYYIAIGMMIAMIAISRKGVNNVGRLSSLFVPVFIVSYIGMGSWVMFQNASSIPSIFKTILISAFTGHAALGAFVGSTILMTASQGMRRICYSSDIAVGFASIIHSETREETPTKQASLTVMEIFLDSFIICTTSITLILVTDVWNTPTEASMMVQQALAHYFPWMHIFIPMFLLMLGFTTIISYFCAGINCANFIGGTVARRLYYFYAVVGCLFFVYFQSEHALTVMSITGALLLLINISAIWKLRNEIDFQLSGSSIEKFASEPVQI